MRDNPAIRPNGLHHWCGTNLLRNGANLRDVQEFLGHTDIKTTANYLHSNEQQLRSIRELTVLRPQEANPQDDGKIIHLPQRPQERERRLRRVSNRLDSHRHRSAILYYLAMSQASRNKHA